MNNTVKTTISFVFGLGIGAAISYVISKRNFTQRLDKEIELLKEEVKQQKTRVLGDLAKNKPSIDEVLNATGNNASIVADKNAREEYEDYTKYYKSDDSAIEPKDDTHEKVLGADSGNKKSSAKKPYVITPDEFGNLGYSEISLTYYSDGVLTEEGNNIKLSIKKTIGEGVIKKFGEHAQDALYVRNDELKADYEILKDNRTYAEVFEEE